MNKKLFERLYKVKNKEEGFLCYRRKKGSS